MPTKKATTIPSVIAAHEKELLAGWIALQKDSALIVSGIVEEGTLRNQSERFLTEFHKATASNEINGITGPHWASVRDFLGDFSRGMAQHGLSPSQIATFVFSLKEPLFTLMREEHKADSQRLADELWRITLLIDSLGLYTTEVFQKSREDVIIRQQEEMLELSTPVVELWDGIVAVPLIGTLDSERTQVVMESLLQHIVTTGAEIAIIDITGVPTVDTLVAQHLIKTVSAARLMGADCIISGIRPQIAQTIVHLGVELSVTSKATMADALQLALRRIGKTVVDRKVAQVQTTSASE